MAIDADELEPRKPIEKPEDMERLSIEELEEYIATLQAEIERAREAIAQKGDHRSEADKFFRS